MSGGNLSARRGIQPKQLANPHGNPPVTVTGVAPWAMGSSSGTGDRKQFAFGHGMPRVPVQQLRPKSGSLGSTIPSSNKTNEITPIVSSGSFQEDKLGLSANQLSASSRAHVSTKRQR